MTSISSSFTALGSSAGLGLAGTDENGTVSVSGTFVGTVQLERSLDGGKSWQVQRTPSTAALSSTVINGPGLFRWTCTAYTSGTIICALADAVTTIQSTVVQNRDGVVITKLTSNGGEFNTIKLTGIESTIAALVGGGQAGATQITYTADLHLVTTCASDNDSIMLPAALPGRVHFVSNTTAKSCQVFAESGVTIDSVASATGVALPAGKSAWYIAFSTTAWRSLLSA
jgi:hypothetical protein